MSFICHSRAMTWTVPEPEEAIRQADVIVVGQFDDKGGYTFVVDEVLKSPTRLPKKMNYDEWVADFKNVWTRGSIKLAKEKTGSVPTILLGCWDKKEKVIVPNHASFWPQQTWKNYLPHTNIPELRKYIQDIIKKQKAEEKSKKKLASLRSGIGDPQGSLLQRTLALSSTRHPKTHSSCLRVFV